MKIWIDIKNSHEPLFFKSIMSQLDHDFFITSRDFGEVQDLLDIYGIEHIKVGGRPEGFMLKRKFGFLVRVLKLLLLMNKVDLSLSHSSIWGIYSAKLKGIKTISFTDNEISIDVNKSHFKYLDFLFYPDCIPKKLLLNQGAREESLIPYSGFKEDIYVASYKPDKNFMSQLPFNNYVVVRPESNQATYVSNQKSIVKPLVEKLLESGYNIIYLPRYKSHFDLIDKNDRIYIPEKALNGLDLCYYSQGVTTGAGTLSREAACLGRPAFSFFPEKNLLSVDKKLIKDGFVIHSRNPSTIVEKLNDTSSFTKREKTSFDSEDFFSKLRRIIEKVNDSKV